MYEPTQTAVVRHARQLTRLKPIDDTTYVDLSRHFDQHQTIYLCLTIGLSNVIHQVHATYYHRRVGDHA